MLDSYFEVLGKAEARVVVTIQKQPHLAIPAEIVRHKVLSHPPVNQISTGFLLVTTCEPDVGRGGKY